MPPFALRKINVAVESQQNGGLHTPATYFQTAALYLYHITLVCTLSHPSFNLARFPSQDPRKSIAQYGGEFIALL